jgi:hypothetical protein
LQQAVFRGSRARARQSPIAAPPARGSAEPSQPDSLRTIAVIIATGRRCRIGKESLAYLLPVVLDREVEVVVRGLAPGEVEQALTNLGECVPVPAFCSCFPNLGCLDS